MALLVEEADAAIFAASAFLFLPWRRVLFLLSICAMDPRLRGECAKIFVSRF